jgi:hypothetical protein
MAATWNIKGTVVIACNCDYGCPCNFNARPSHGKCEGGWTWHIAEGAFDGVPLNDLNFSVFVKWPGAIHEGNGEALFFIDERASGPQQKAITRLLKGEAGGPWGILGWTWPVAHGPKLVPYSVHEDGMNTRVTAGNCFELEFTTIKNPVNGSEAHPSMILPEGLIVKRADLGASKVFRLHDDINMEYPGQYTAIGPFDYSGQLATAP